MDWLLCAKFGAFYILMISFQCSCHWNVQVNRGKSDNGTISWENLQLKRQKREWIIPAVVMREGEDNRHRNPIAKVHSDIQEIKANIRYTMTGPGVDQPPFGVFVMDPRNGNLNVTGMIVDREQIPVFFLTVYAQTATGHNVEKPLELRVRVMDINDNAPIFSQTSFVGSVEERSRANTLVMQMFASDADEAGTLHSQIAYKILSQTPAQPPMFIMNQFTGELFTMSDFLDREQFSSYSISVLASDMNGGAGGLAGQCSSSIQILDVNDNFPTLEFDSYSVEFMENMIGTTNLRIKVFDADEMYSDNWIAVYNIVSGNEGGWFAIDTDSQTNEGILRIVKALDYEAMQSLNLGFMVTNRAAFHSSVISEFKAQATSIVVNVQNVVEGPVFVPSVMRINIPEGLRGQALLSYILARMQAIDMDTGKPATNIRYWVEDRYNWFSIDSTTGEVRLNHDITTNTGTGGNYTATIFGESPDLPNRPANATVILTMPRANDNCPVVTNEWRQTCTKDMRVEIQAYDNDTAPNGPPFTFNLQPTPNDWRMERINDTSVALVGVVGSSPRNATLNMIVLDNGNRSCPLPVSLRIQVCDCEPTGTCIASPRTSKSVSLGPAAIGLMVLGFLVLLLALLLLPLCLCGSAAAAASTFVPVAAGYDEACRPWGTEGATPEDVDMTTTLITSGGPEYPVFTTNTLVGAGTGGGGGGHSGGLGGIGVGRAGVLGAGAGVGGGGRVSTGNETYVTGGGRDIYDERMMGGSNIEESLAGVLYPNSGPVNMAYVENYFAEKADAYGNEDESRPANDCLLIYDNEGIGSLAGSIGCCSFIADDLDDDYLDTLGPKFRTLAELCIGQEIGPGLSEEEPRVFINVPVVETDTTIRSENSTLVTRGSTSVPAGNTTYVTESTYSSSNLQPARPIPDSFIPGNVLVTETYTTTGASMQPPTYIVEPRNQPGIVVTERVVRPTSVVREIPSGSNVFVTERVVRPVSVAHELRDLPNLVESSDVVLSERVLGSSNARMSNAFSFQDISEAQNVVVTERFVQPASNAQSNFSFQPDMSRGQNVIVTEKTVMSGSGMQNHLLSAEPLLTQAIGSTSPSLTRSKVTKYSTVEYTK
ncbi:desmoglein-4-like isoform X2 [Pelobates fuscus]|uniref:desmoglein-4-like isoform X2 n=1 Tax=Pelobates fuscus TaxID=191477 RepID=UPI002FE43870